MKACYYAGLLLCGVFISAISQVLLKKAAQRQYSSPLREYMNPLVIFVYIGISWIAAFYGTSAGSNELYICNLFWSDDI